MALFAKKRESIPDRIFSVICCMFTQYFSRYLFSHLHVLLVHDCLHCPCCQCIGSPTTVSHLLAAFKRLKGTSCLFKVHALQSPSSRACLSAALAATMALEALQTAALAESRSALSLLQAQEPGTGAGDPATVSLQATPAKAAAKKPAKKGKGVKHSLSGPEVPQQYDAHRMAS